MTMPALNATTAVPSPSTASSFLSSVKSDFLGVPARVRADLAQADALNQTGSQNTGMLPAASDALSQLPGVVQTLNQTQTDWTAAIGPLAVATDAVQSGGGASLTAAVNIIAQSGPILTIFAELGTAEQQLDLIAQQALTSDQYAAWKANSQSGTLGQTVEWGKYALIGLAGYVGYKLFLAPRRQQGAR